jgi:hypothetical protein
MACDEAWGEGSVLSGAMREAVYVLTDVCLCVRVRVYERREK